MIVIFAIEHQADGSIKDRSAFDNLQKFIPEATQSIMLNHWSVIKINSSHLSKKKNLTPVTILTVLSMLHEDNWKLIPRIEIIYSSIQTTPAYIPYFGFQQDN